jgi:hypothetical protein
MLGTLYAAAALSYAFVFLVDPYDLRAGGVRVRLADTTYADAIVPRLVSVAARDGSDLILVGASTSMAITPAMLREAFPDAERPVNLSFVSMRAPQLATVLERIETSTTLRRVIVNVEFTFNRDIEWISPVSETRYYASAWHDPVPEFGADAVATAFTVLETGVVDRPEWRRRHPDRPDFMFVRKPLVQRPGAVAHLAAAADASRSWVTSAPEIDCGEVPVLRKTLVPFLRRMSARGVPVDLLLPPYSLAVYSEWSLNYRGKWFPGRGSVYANLMALKRCTVLAADGLPNVRVHAFDTDFELTRNLALYYDSSHIYEPGRYRYILHRVARGDAVLRAADWPRFEATLRKAIEEFGP